jgi:hypothetical protein
MSRVVRIRNPRPSSSSRTPSSPWSQAHKAIIEPSRKNRQVQERNHDDMVYPLHSSYLQNTRIIITSSSQHQGEPKLCIYKEWKPEKGGKKKKLAIAPNPMIFHFTFPSILRTPVRGDRGVLHQWYPKRLPPNPNPLHSGKQIPNPKSQPPLKKKREGGRRLHHPIDPKSLPAALPTH